jgi:iron-regulated transporter 1
VNVRGAFSSTEASIQNLFELLSYLTTIIFSRPENFQYPVFVSASAVMAAGAIYAVFVRKRRGHLLHLRDCLEAKTAT